ncbi:MAG: PAS domain S-box protein [Acidobacteria bacterium]|nr:MAG: PAS domain S-box protein [Acidobacteriota bacterium]
MPAATPATLGRRPDAAGRIPAVLSRRPRDPRFARGPVRRGGGRGRRAGQVPESGIHEVVIGAVGGALRGRVRSAVRRARLEALDDGPSRGRIAVAGPCTPDRGAAFVAAARAAGAAGVVAIAPRGDDRAALLDAGADEAVDPRIPVAELAARLARLARRAGSAGRAADAERLDEQRALFQAVVDAIPVSLYAIDRDYRVVVWNRGREAGPFGRPRGEVLGANLFDIVGDEPRLREEFERVFRTGRPEAVEVEARGGRPRRTYRVEKVPMRLGDGPEVTHVITFARDVTAQRALERSMAQAEKLAAIGRLAAGIAHEINNPLATIASCAEAMRGSLAEPPDEATRREMIDDAGVIEEEAYRCKEILQALLDFARPSTAETAPCDLERIVERTARLVRHNPKLRDVTLRCVVAPALPQPTAHENHLVEALMALVLNAADAAPHGEVTIRAERGEDGETVVLAVEDDGPGIPVELRERIFDPFFTTKPPGHGTGLGLSVVYGLMEALGGSVRVSSVPGAGSRFELVLPAPVEIAEHEQAGVR